MREYTLPIPTIIQPLDVKQQPLGKNDKERYRKEIEMRYTYMYKEREMRYTYTYVQRKRDEIYIYVQVWTK